MKLQKVLVAVMLVAAAGFATAMLLMPAPDVEAGANCRCIGPGGTTIVTGYAPHPDCPWAEVDAWNKANGLCGADGFCDFDVVDLGCQPGGTSWKLQVTFRCEICF